MDIIAAHATEFFHKRKAVGHTADSFSFMEITQVQSRISGLWCFFQRLQFLAQYIHLFLYAINLFLHFSIE